MDTDPTPGLLLGRTAYSGPRLSSASRCIPRNRGLLVGRQAGVHGQRRGKVAIIVRSEVVLAAAREKAGCVVAPLLAARRVLVQVEIQAVCPGRHAALCPGDVCARGNVRAKSVELVLLQTGAGDG